MSAPKDAPPAELVKFDFHGHAIDVWRRPADGAHLVDMAHLCAPIDVKNPRDQIRKLKRTTWARVGVIPVESAESSGILERGIIPRSKNNGKNLKVPDRVAIDIRSIAGWLFTINPKKVAPQHRVTLALFQMACADDLADRFLGRRGEANEVELGRRVDEARAPLLAELAEVKRRNAALATKAAEPPPETIGGGRQRTHLRDLVELVAVATAKVSGVSLATERSRIYEDLRSRFAVRKFDDMPRLVWETAVEPWLKHELATLDRDGKLRAETAAARARADAEARQGDLFVRAGLSVPPSSPRRPTARGRSPRRRSSRSI